MEAIINSEGLFHIAKKIIAYIDYKFVWTSENEALKTIQSLQLTCKRWNTILKSQEMCKMWQQISQERKIFGESEELSILLSDLYKKAYETNDEKFMWQLSIYTLANLRSQLTTETYVRGEPFWRSYQHYRHITGLDIEPTPLEVFICNGPYQLVEKLWQNSDFYMAKEGPLARLLRIAIFNFCRKDLVDILFSKFSDCVSECVQYPSSEFILSIIREIIACFEIAEHNVMVKKALIDILNMIMHNAINNQCVAINPCRLFHSGLINGIYNPFIMALHYDRDHEYIDLIHPFIRHFKKVKYPKEIEFGVLKRINKYAIFRDYPEIASIVAEKVGSYFYVRLMQEIST